jgi:hypothetical protein
VSLNRRSEASTELSEMIHKWPSATRSLLRQGNGPIEIPLFQVVGEFP